MKILRNETRVFLCFLTFVNNRQYMSRSAVRILLRIGHDNILVYTGEGLLECPSACILTLSVGDSYKQSRDI